MLLDRSLISSYKLGQVKRESQHPISSLEFYSSYLLSSSSIDETLNLYEVDHAGGGTGGLLLRKSINSHKYGLGPTVFAHGPLNCLIASTKAAVGGGGSGGRIHLLSLYDNSYQREFRGPEEEMVKEIKVSPTPSAGPIHDSFISLTSNTMSIWDLKSPSRSAYMSIGSSSSWGKESHVAIDGKGMIFALTVGNLLKLFDIRNYSKGPFASFDFSGDASSGGTSLKTTPTTTPATTLKTNIKGVLFTPDGSSILLNNNSTSMSVVDSFDCQLKKTLQSQGNPSTLTNPSITPNGRFILAGRSDCTISVWDLKEEEEDGDGNSDVVEDFLSLEGHNITPGFVEHHPNMGIMASACSNIGLWVPDIL